MRLWTALSFSLLLLLPAIASADSLSFTGSLDPTNPDEVFLATFSIASSSNVVIQSYGYGGSAGAPGGTNAAGAVIAPGGFDTYISLFSGTGATATFFDSNDDGGCGPATADPVCEDSRLDETALAAGNYTVALTLPGNFSLAENYGTGDLGDGFIDLQGDYYDFASNQVRTSNFAFDITSNTALVSGGTTTTVPSAATPEPSSLALLASGLLFGAAKLDRNSRKTGTPTLIEA
jgi:hypothetical protein